MSEINKLQKEIKKFCTERDWDQFHNAKDLAIGISTEAAELLDIFRFKSLEEIEEMFANKGKEKIEEELSDILFFVLRFAQVYDINLNDSLLKKIEENKKKYPLDKSKGSNKKYTEFE
jgi:NTP pyrophosphatase (non-canonical NTP hydrolase)